MTYAMGVVLWGLVGALANRLRGGWCGHEIHSFFPFWNTSFARLFFSVVISTPVFITYSLLQSVTFTLILFISFICGENWVRIFSPWRGIKSLTLRGLFITFPAGFFFGLRPFAFCGLLMGLCYFLGLHSPFYLKENDGYIWRSSEWGEVFFGFILGVFIVLSVL